MWPRVVQRAPDFKREADSPTLSLSVSICRHLESPASVEKVVMHWTRVPFFMLIIYCFYTKLLLPKTAKVKISQKSNQLLSTDYCCLWVSWDLRLQETEKICLIGSWWAPGGCGIWYVWGEGGSGLNFYIYCMVGGTKEQMVVDFEVWMRGREEGEREWGVVVISEPSCRVRGLLPLSLSLSFLPLSFLPHPF